MSGPSAAGVLPIDKPEGPTSHDIVALARRRLGVRRIGHTGTLDPFASGLLLLCIGAATRLAEYLSPLRKRYVATATLGVETDTDDRTGVSLRASDSWRELGYDEVAAAFTMQMGERVQVPPAYSAKKVGGERSYRAARRGEEATPPPAVVRIHSIQILAYDPPEVRFEVECSAGTYVRAIARDAGRHLGCGAHLSALRRTAIGPFRVEEAIPVEVLDDLDAAWSRLIPPLAALPHLPAVELGWEEARRITLGQTVPADAELPSGTPLALVHEGELLAIGEAGEGRIRPRKVLRDLA